MDVPSLLTFFDVIRVEPVGQGFGRPPFGADHHVVSGLVPEVVSKGRRLPRVLPVTDHLERLAVQQDEATWGGGSRGHNDTAQQGALRQQPAERGASPLPLPDGSPMQLIMI